LGYRTISDSNLPVSLLSKKKASIETLEIFVFTWDIEMFQSKLIFFLDIREDLNLRFGNLCFHLDIERFQSKLIFLLVGDTRRFESEVWKYLSHLGYRNVSIEAYLFDRNT